MCRVWFQLAGLRSARSKRALAQIKTFATYTKGTNGSHNRALETFSRTAATVISKIGAKFPTVLKMLKAERLQVHVGRGKPRITPSPKKIQDRPTSKGTKYTPRQRRASSFTLNPKRCYAEG